MFKKYTLLASLGLATASHAATLVVDGFDSNSTSIGGFTVTSVVNSLGIEHNFTQTGDLDGRGNGNDTLSFTITERLYNGSTVAGGLVTLGTEVQLASPTGTAFGGGTLNAGDTVRFTLEDIVYTSGAAGAEATFLGFDSVFTAGATGDRTSALGLTDAVVRTTPRFTTLAFPDSDTADTAVTFTSTDAVTVIRDLDFSFEVVPEPSSTSLLGLGGLALLARRRRA